ncbi:MAG: helix-turn-helix domain-containing protein [Limnochordia bacterium]
MSKLAEEIKDLIALEQEGGYWDFKREWYTRKSNMLHDIICMANNLENRDAYIIIGVDQETGFEVVDVLEDENRRNTQQIVDFLREKNFASSIRPTVYTRQVCLWGKTIDVIVIKNDRNTPYYLKSKYQDVRANHVYTRVMDTNTPKDKSADRTHIESLWKKSFIWMQVHLNVSRTI